MVRQPSSALHYYHPMPYSSHDQGCDWYNEMKQELPDNPLTLHLDFITFKYATRHLGIITGHEVYSHWCGRMLWMEDDRMSNNHHFTIWYSGVELKFSDSDYPGPVFDMIPYWHDP